MKRISFFLFSVLFGIASLAAAPKVGYRGFVNIHYLGGNDGVYYGWNDNGIGISTTHGYQINKHVFVGAGVGVQYHGMQYFESGVSVPFYADFRFDIGNSSVTPFIEAKAGYSASTFSGVYLSPTFGVRIPAKAVGINIMVGYSAQEFKYEGYYRVRNAFDHTLNLGFGVDF